MEKAETARLHVGITPGPFPLNPKSPTIDWSLFNTSTPDPCRWSLLVASGIIPGQPAVARSPTWAWPNSNSAIPGRNSIVGLVCSPQPFDGVSASAQRSTFNQHLHSSRDASLSVRFQPPLRHRKCSSHRAPFLDFITVCVRRFQ